MGTVERSLKKCSSVQYSSDSSSDSVEPGYILDTITGELRKRNCMDDFPTYVRQRYRNRWEALWATNRENRFKGEPIPGYEDGDSELDFSDFEEMKKERKGKKNKKRKL